MTSMRSRGIPSRSAAGSCAAHSNWLSSSRALVRMASSRTRPPSPDSIGTVEKDTAGTSQPPERPTFWIGEAVIDPLPASIEVFASRQRQPASRLGGQYR